MQTFRRRAETATNNEVLLYGIAGTSTSMRGSTVKSFVKRESTFCDRGPFRGYKTRNDGHFIRHGETVDL